MNRFGPTPAATQSAIDRAVNSWMAGRHTHIDTIMDLQAASMTVHEITRHESPVAFRATNMNALLDADTSINEITK
jgi:hypothetical protein